MAADVTHCWDIIEHTNTSMFPSIQTLQKITSPLTFIDEKMSSIGKARV